MSDDGDQAEKDAANDLDYLKRQEWARWRAAAERKYPRFPVKAVGPRTANDTTKGDGTDER